MATAGDHDAMLLEMVEQTLDCDVDELVVYCPLATWNQVFLALNNLRRGGQETFLQQGLGRYTVGLASQAYPLERRRSCFAIPIT